MRPKTVFLTIVCTLAMAGLLGTAEQSSSGQQNIRKQPACTMYCGDGPDTFNLGARPCWGGPLPAGGAGDHFKSLAAEDQATICRNLASGNTNASCPAVKTILSLCKGKDLPKEKEGDKKPPCKERGEYDVPWFDPSAQGCQQIQNTKMNANWTPANGGTCTITLTACNYTVLTFRVNYVSETNGLLSPTSIDPSLNLSPQQLAARGMRPITSSECNAQFYEKIYGDHPNTVCCDIWREGVNAGSGCNPETDADCDGLPNDRDDFLNAQPYYAPPRPGSYQESLFHGASDFNPANFDPRPSGLSWDELMPNEPCKNCKWMATSGKLTCSPDGRAEHEYKATWVCPSTGATRTVTKRAPASAPCTPPNRRP